jgi:hypothetical protein
MPANLRPYQFAVGILLAVKSALFISLVVGNPDMFLYGDGLEYVARAKDLVAFGVYGNYAPDGTFAANAFRLPGYPAFLAITTVSSGTTQTLVWSSVQLLLFHAWLLIAGGWICRRHGGRSALYFVVALSVPLPWVHYVMAIQSDFLFAVLTFSAVMLTMTAFEPTSSRVGCTLGAIFCMASASLTRPDLVFAPFWLVPFIAAAAIWNRRAPGSVVVWPTASVAAASLGAMVLWALRNYVETGRLVFTSLTDMVIRFFSSHVDASTPTGSGLGLVEAVELMFRNGWRVIAEFVPALAQVFFNPSRWYLHRYFESWRIDLATKDVPFSQLGFSGLALAEQVFVIVGVLVPLALFAVLLRALYLMWRRRIPVQPWPLALLLWTMAYLVLQKGVWGALTPGSGVRYAMSIWPFIVYLGGLAFTDPALFKGTGPQDDSRRPPASHAG